MSGSIAARARDCRHVRPPPRPPRSRFHERPNPDRLRGLTGHMGIEDGLSMSSSRNCFVGVILCVAFALAAGRARAAEPNACGCTQTDSGACICDKKARCGCPGQCEPRGCEAQRERTFQRELDAETRKAREADRQHATPKDEASPKAAPATTAAPRP